MSSNDLTPQKIKEYKSILKGDDREQILNTLFELGWRWSSEETTPEVFFDDLARHVDSPSDDIIIAAQNFLVLIRSGMNERDNLLRFLKVALPILEKQLDNSNLEIVENAGILLSFYYWNKQLDSKIIELLEHESSEVVESVLLNLLERDPENENRTDLPEEFVDALLPHILTRGGLRGQRAAELLAPLAEKLNEKPGLLEKIERMFDKARHEHRRRLAFLAAGIYMARDEPKSVHRLFEHPNVHIRNGALEYLADRQSSGKFTFSGEIMERARRLLKDPEVDTQRNAARLLAADYLRKGELEALRNLLIAKPDWTVGEATLKELARQIKTRIFDATPLLPELIELLSNREFGEERAEALENFALQNPQNAQKLQELIKTRPLIEDPEIARLIQSTLMACRQGEFDPPLSLYDWLVKASEHKERGEFQAALQAYENCLYIDPENAPAWHNMGLAYAGLGMIDDELRVYLKALEINPEQNVSWTNLGTVYKKLNEPEKAVAAYRKAVEINPEYPLGWGNLASGLKYVDDIPGAIQACETGLKVCRKLEEEDPYYSVISQRGLLYYNYACYLALTNRPTKALENLALGIKDTPNYADLAQNDSDFDALREDPEFRRLTGQAD